MTSTNNGRATWNRKREERRRDASSKRVANHAVQLRREAANRGSKGSAEAEWNILRSAVRRLPEGQQEAEWKTISAVLRQLTAGLNSGHKQ